MAQQVSPLLTMPEVSHRSTRGDSNTLLLIQLPAYVPRKGLKYLDLSLMGQMDF